MSIVTGIAVYFIIRWLVIFAVLPWGVKGQHEDNNVVKGTEPGAPVHARMKRKAIQTTIVAAIIWAVIFVIVKYHLITLDDIKFLPDFTPKDY